jgi:hypothetical protein
MVGGAAYYAGKKGSERSQREADQDAQIQDLQAQQAYAAAPPPAPAGGGGMSQAAMDQLKQLADLHTQGVLTDAEFEVQKQKILQGM